MTTLIKLSAFLLAIHSFGQPAPSSYSSIESKLQIPRLEESKSEIEIRLFANGSLSFEDNFVWIRKEGGQWTVKSFSFLNSDEDGSFKLQKVSDEKFRKNWQSKIEELLSENIFGYSDQKDVQAEIMKEYKKKNGDDAFFFVNDGTAYTLTIKVKGNSRVFTLHSPWNYLEKSPESKELNWFCDLLDLIDKNVKVRIKG